jgi:hypothetical protein
MFLSGGLRDLLANRLSSLLLCIFQGEADAVMEEKVPIENMRNIAIIAHVDHGRSLSALLRFFFAHCRFPVCLSCCR